MEPLHPWDHSKCPVQWGVLISGGKVLYKYIIWAVPFIKVSLFQSVLIEGFHCTVEGLQAKRCTTEDCFQQGQHSHCLLTLDCRQSLQPTVATYAPRLPTILFPSLYYIWSCNVKSWEQLRLATQCHQLATDFTLTILLIYLVRTHMSTRVAAVIRAARSSPSYSWLWDRRMSPGCS